MVKGGVGDNNQTEPQALRNIWSVKIIALEHVTRVTSDFDFWSFSQNLDFLETLQIFKHLVWVGIGSAFQVDYCV